jgi:V/A-type H+-transporting ATPase subunit D
MPTLRHLPPGRAGRIWLQRRLAVAGRGAYLLDQKLRLLHAERQRLALQVERTGAAWETAAHEASRWLVRGAMLGGQRGIRLAGRPGAAEVELEWSYLMGVRYPSGARCTTPAEEPDAAPPDNAALVSACEAHRRAAQAAVTHAAAVAALHVLEAEEVGTRRRLRAIEDRLMPRLQQALAQIQLGLEELEHAEGVQLRWAAARQPGPVSHARAGEGP